MKKNVKPIKKRRINLPKLTRISFLPSVFTMFNLFLGYLALIYVYKGEFLNASYFLIFSMILDSVDGTVARLTKTESNFGMQLDSLADAISFGLVTSYFIYVWGFESMLPDNGKIISFIFLSAGVIRLARFNVYKEADAFPSNVFIGLPIPFASMSIVSVYLLIQKNFANITQAYIFAGFVIIVSILMISNIQYRTVKRIKSKFNLIFLLFIAIVASFAIMYRFLMIPIICFSYLISPVFFFIYDKFKKKPQEIEKEN